MPSNGTPLSSLFFFISTPSGLLDPTVWSAAKWRITNNKITIGTATIWSAKNLVNVGSDIAKSPLIQMPSSGPINGIVVKRFIITCAPQYDICPQGSRYPIKASAISARYINTPNNQINSLGFLKDPYISALNICK